MRDVIIPLDFPGKADTLRFLDKFEGKKPYVKIGMELFYAEGPSIVEEIRRRGYKIFLDLKLHDIPNTVKRAAARICSLGVDMFNIHAAGGSEMMRAAAEEVAKCGGKKPLLIAVTQLTSVSEAMLKAELLIGKSMEETVKSYALNAKNCGLDGVVCSPWEVGAIKAACGSAFVTVTPGVRFEDSAADDQARVATPSKARGLGSDYIVVGRPITAAADPVAAYERCVREFA